MEQERIRELLSKYYDGKTSEEEELMLREYLGSAAAPASLSGEFGYLAAGPEQVPEPSEGFEARLDDITRMKVRLASPRTRWPGFAGIGAAAAIIAAAVLIFSVSVSPANAGIWGLVVSRIRRRERDLLPPQPARLAE